MSESAGVETLARQDFAGGGLAARLYRRMLLTRRVEEILAERYHEAAEMRCPMHFCNGQEAAPAAMAEHLRPEDAVYCHYRSHGWYLAKGAPLDAMIAEFHGKATGANGGMAGSMELAHHDSRFYSGAIVGGPIALALGHAFAQAHRADRVQGGADAQGGGILGGMGALTLAVVGDGAFDEGVGYECLSFAALHRLPLLVICENNGYAAHTGLRARGAPDLVAARAAAFGLPVQVLDGNDPLQLADRLGTVVAAMRAGSGPAFCEVQTYRTCSHVGPESDDVLAYRSAAEVIKWQRRDPIPYLGEVLRGEGVDEAAFAALRAGLDAEVQAAYAAAQAAAPPTAADLARLALPAGDAQPAGDWLTDLPFVEVVETLFQGGQAEARLAPY